MCTQQTRFLDARLFSSVVLAVAPAVTMDEASSLSQSRNRVCCVHIHTENLSRLSFAPSIQPVLPLGVRLLCSRGWRAGGLFFPVSVVVGAAVPAAVCRWRLCPRCPGVGRCLSGVYLSSSSARVKPTGAAVKGALQLLMNRHR